MYTYMSVSRLFDYKSLRKTFVYLGVCVFVSVFECVIVRVYIHECNPEIVWLKSLRKTFSCIYVHTYI